MSYLHQFWDLIYIITLQICEDTLYTYLLYLCVSFFLFKDHQDWPIPACSASGMPCYS